ncbi:hypothetical protein BJ123_1258 [Rhodopseudomonas thermotolerans]|uniref:DUF7662 domain-containing protein n=2 Tax=Rhodopseudomonas TaxID=1073 RepID=A0A336JTE1_9BRAD|nr:MULTISPECIES: hypothetical protein [Rhodopseudomonas]RED27657.1 hypothetical protein BJ125_1258 [Rhodopseudomonas pentothenatexigens]REF91192.1 hypothetical protein BJ123_1258 [Rhodopseudomonas thermotolerans]SSW92802.1 hypothetical protein SAMN05892882_1258 [Rhodopseudomonas pentothenatexigens]
MKNFEPLREYLAQQTAAELVLSMAEIEEMLGFDLPRASQRAAWWDSTYALDEQMPQREACLAAGYIATRLPDGSGVRFRRMKTGRSRWRS